MVRKDESMEEQLEAAVTSWMDKKWPPELAVARLNQTIEKAVEKSVYAWLDRKLLKVGWWVGRGAMMTVFSVGIAAALRSVSIAALFTGGK